MLSFVVPAHDEQATIGAVVAAIDSAARSAGVEFEVIVVDDSSTDATAVLAEAAGARVVPVALRQISGIGPAKLDRYGEDVLEVLAEVSSNAN